MAHKPVRHDRPFTVRILAALLATALYYGVVVGLSLRVFVDILHSGSWWVTLPMGAAAGLTVTAWCSLTWLWIRLREQPFGVPLVPVHFRELYRVVRQTAAKLGTGEPPALHMTEKANAYSMFYGILGINVHWTGIGIGAPLVPVLSEVELKGVIAHELGHMQSLRARAGDGWYMWAMYNYWSCSDTLARSTTWMRVLCPQVWYAFVMTHLTWPIACQEELAADAHAVRAVRPHEHGAALESIAIAQEMFREFMATEVTGLLDLGVLPGNVFEGFRRHVARQTYADRESLLARYHDHDARRDFAHGLAHDAPAPEASPECGIMPDDRWDPHPRLTDRVEHLLALAPPGATYCTTGGGPLIGLDPAIERQLTRRLLEPLVATRPGTRWRSTDWEALDDQFGGRARPAKKPRRRPAQVAEEISWES